MTNAFQSGYESGVDEATRRALFDLRRQIEAIPDGGGGGGGDPGAVSYVHNQGIVASVWSIVHDLGWFPNVTVIDSSGRTVEGDLQHLSSVALRLTFSGAFTGVAYLS